jgi:hypothetical protein
MNHGVEASQIRWNEIAKILLGARNRHGIGDQRALVEVAGVHPGDVVSGPNEMRRHDRPEVAPVSGHQNSS